MPCSRRRISESAMPSGLPAVRAATSRSFRAARTRRTVDSVRVSFVRIAAFSRSVKASRIPSSELAASPKAYPVCLPAANSQGLFLSLWKSEKFHRRRVDKQRAKRIFRRVGGSPSGRCCRPERPARITPQGHSFDGRTSRGLALAATVRLQRGPGVGGWHGILGARHRGGGTSGRRGLLQHRDHRISGDSDRPVLCRANHYLYLSPYRQ